jgi:outer membrane protein
MLRARRRFFRLAVGSLALGAATLAISVARADPHRLTVEDVVRLSVASHPSVTAVRARSQAAHHLKKSATGRMLPTIAVSDEFQHYDSPFDIAFGGATFRARDQDTNTFVASANQPLLGLLRRSEDYQSQARSADAADASVRVAEARTREGVEIQYLRMFEARAMEDIAHASEAELADEVTVTEARLKAGSVTQAELLRVKVAQANARQQGIAAHSQSIVARASILSAIGSPPGETDIEFAPPASLLTTAASVAAAAPEAALRDRPEIAEARFTAESARHQAHSRTFALFPEVDLEAAYTRVDGQIFAPKNSAFVGIRAGWPIWEWGTTYQAEKAAAAQADAAEDNLESQRRQVLVEVTSSAAELDAASSAVDVAEQAIKSAEEAYRVTTVEVHAGAATVTDLLDAEAALTRARLNLVRSRYEQAVAGVEVERAAGRQ